MAALLVAAGGGACAAARRPASATGPADAGVREGVVRTPAGPLAYDVRGSGPAVVLLHGGLVDRRMWDPQVDVLARGHRVLRYDLRPQGRSPAATGPYSPVEDLRVLLDSLGVSAADVVGLSLGSIVAADFALAYPARVRRLVLAGPALSGMPVDSAGVEEGRAMVAAARAGGPDSALAVVLRSRVFAASMALPAVAPRLRAIVLGQRAVFAAAPAPTVPAPGGPAYGRLGELRMPVLTVVGDRDVPDVRRAAERLVRDARARRVTVPGAGHMVNMDAPELFTAAVLAFLDAPYRSVDLMPDFWRFWDRSAGAPEDERLRAFRRAVVDPHAAVYGLMYAGADDASLRAYLAEVAADSARLRRVSRELPAQVLRRWQSFRARLDDLRPDADVYLVPVSRNNVGGFVRPLGRRDVLVLGFDQLAGITSASEFSVLVHHELTHLYQMQVNPEFRDVTERFFVLRGRGGPTPLYQLMWLEGLATYASRVLNPSAPMGEVMNERLAARIRGDLPRLARAMREQMDATTPQAIGAFVFDGDERAGVPAKTAYYVGMLVAERLARRHTLGELARLRGPGLRREIDAALSELASRPAARDR